MEIVTLYLIVTYIIGIGFFIKDFKEDFGGTLIALFFSPIFIPLKIGQKLKEKDSE
jgi:hypothetical protein